MATSDVLDPERVAGWLGEHVPELDGPLAFTPIAGGRSNLTFRVDDAAGRTVILRRPPLGELLASAHDVAREHRVMRALAGTAAPVPRALALCEDPAVLGVPFTVMSFVDGLVLRGPDDARPLSPETRGRAALAVVDALAALHSVDPAAVRPDGRERGADYALRQLSRWRRQWSATGDDGRVDALGERLERRIPPQQHATVVHGDYRLDNVILAPDGAVRAIVDWELWTFGDPLADLALMLVYWVESGDAHPPLGAAATTLPGFPARQALIERYAAVSGRDVEALDFWLAFAAFKLAVILQGVLQRTRAGSYGDAAAEVEWLPGSIAALLDQAERTAP
jgi:aminoglycoside phosphotransferase (APT) family kinase protein